MHTDRELSYHRTFSRAYQSYTGRRDAYKNRKEGMGEKRYRLPMCSTWSFAAKTCVGSDAPVGEISM